MGNYIVKKGILLDESDFETGPHATFDSLADAVAEFLQNEFGNLDPEMDDTPPWLEFDAIVSERFDAAEIYSWKPAHWIDPAAGFRAALLKECKRLGLPKPEELLDLTDADPETLEPGLRKAVCDAVMAGDYHGAETLISALSVIRCGGIPGVMPFSQFSRDGEERLYDLRAQSHPPGTRILAEIGFNWGQ